jgi:hypothetical protein
MYMHVKAFEYKIQAILYLAAVEVMIEREEKVSVNLKTFVENNTEKLKNDGVLFQTLE